MPEPVITSDPLQNPVKSYEIDGEKIEHQTLRDQIEADKYRRRIRAARNPISAITVFNIGKGNASR